MINSTEVPELQDEERPKSLANSFFSWEPFRRVLSGSPTRFSNFAFEAEILGLKNSGPIWAPKLSKNGLEFAKYLSF